jgi:hypothetical protein
MSKLPKQWRHWCADQKLKIHGYKKGQRQWQWFCLKGKGYVWRVNCYGMLQRGDSYKDFDRWALCSIDEVPLPLTLAEFRAAVKLLLEKAHG